MKNTLLRLCAALLVAVALMGILSGCNTAEPHVTDPSGSIGSADHTGTDGTDSTTGAVDPIGTTGSNPAVDETISGTETTEPSTNPTTNPTNPTTQPTTPETKPTQPSECSHDWSDWTTKKAATCTEDGSEERKCSKCGEKEQRAATATGHSFGSWSATKKATCDTNGVKTRKCSKCGNEETQTIAATGHNWDEGKVTTTPTSCSDMGIKTYTCQTCGKTKTEQIKGNHTFGSWSYEEYTYTQDGVSRVSHRKVRTCTKCGYKETDGTPNHYCARGSDNHVVTTVKEGTCTTKATMRSTCKICGWYVEYEGKKGKCNWVDKEVHLSDYGTYTNELDALVSECSSCGDRAVVYYKGEGWSDYNRYRVNIGVTQGSAYAPASPINDNMTLVDHPEWQTVKRDFVYDSDGYVKQFTIYWWYNGSRYSQVIKCGAGEIEAWFAQYGLTGSSSSAWTVKIYGTYVQPYSVGYSG